MLQGMFGRMNGNGTTLLERDCAPDTHSWWYSKSASARLSFSLNQDACRAWLPSQVLSGTERRLSVVVSVDEYVVLSRLAFAGIADACGAA